MVTGRTLVALALAAALMVGAAAGQERKPAIEGTFKQFKYRTVEGSTMTLSDVLGKATLVVFFFPTCQYCNVALPVIQKLHDSYKDSGLLTVWINVLPEQDRMLPRWRSSHGFTVPILLGGHGVQKDYSLTMTPTHYLLDAAGHILSRHDGFKLGDETELERRIQQALFPTSQPAR